MPEQKALPDPVRIRTIACEFATSSKARYELVDEFKADGIPLFGTIQENRGDRAIIRHINCAVAHERTQA